MGVIYWGESEGDLGHVLNRGGNPSKVTAAEVREGWGT